ncbi:MAG: glycosyltransferase family 2 protein, partial [Sphingobacteriales bacterium]|nr:glycosyltransferase family 2 protein [Sphingobacteriales bacterium]
LLAGQVLFYLLAFTGWLFRNKNVSIPGFFVPFYFFIMNYAVYLGFLRFILKKQSVRWERAKRAS